MEGCLACELTQGRRELPGGRIYATDHRVVEHCIGPLGLGTMVVKPLRHVTHVWDLTVEESAELGPLLLRVARAQRDLLAPGQVYVRLWSHAGWQPGHIHFVLQPVPPNAPDRYEQPGPALQMAMFEAGDRVAGSAVEEFARRMRAALGPL
jgi:diadenosine tetraphosphate (Ap4A) HIT family hydrolase